MLLPETFMLFMAGTAQKVSTKSKGGNIPAGTNTGKWTDAEHAAFLEGLNIYGKKWKKIAEMVPTRTLTQIHTHAQKHLHTHMHLCLLHSRWIS